MSRVGVGVGTAIVLLLSAAWVVAPAVVPSGDGSAAAHTFTPLPTADGNRSERAERRRVEDALIVNANPDELPPGCSEVAGERTVTIRAGRRYAEPGEMFGYSTDVVRVEPCTRLSVTFINEDSIRHQWMVHGLPRETYPMGMFSIELTGPGKATGTFVVPSGDRTLLIHCSLLQHEQKGMHARLVVGEGATPTTPTPAATTARGQPGFGAPAAVLGVAILVLASRRYARGRTDRTEENP